MSDNDSRFFTNTDTDSLLNRFQTILKGAEYFDVLVGYFHSSGFNNIYKSLENVKKIRILIGLSTDAEIVSMFEKANKQLELQLSNHNIKENYRDSIQKEFENSEDNNQIAENVALFTKFINENKLEIRVVPERNIHAKVYITRYYKEDRDFGNVITGSSNFTENGLKANREFNVELKDKPDVEFALKRFEDLWENSTDVTKDYIETVNTKTWLNPNITPYEIYLKFLYEYFKEDINFDKENNFFFPDGFMELDYQKQAIANAKKILNNYNGVFLADVVGLGKTYITSLLLQQFPNNRKLIICPPALEDNWKNAMRDFRVSGYEIISIGKIEKLSQKSNDYDIIVVDEAHRFRNEMTYSYTYLHTICQNKKVILVSATPINNYISDLLSLIKLFQPEKQSNIPSITNLSSFFKIRNTRLKKYKKGSRDYINELSLISKEIRGKILSHLMIRRTRTEIKKYFKNDIEKQKLHFPVLEDPRRIIYYFDDNIEKKFDKSILLMKIFKYSRYTPLLFLKPEAKKKIKKFNLVEQQQKNIGGFMKVILVKRLESSFYAFNKTTARFVESYKKFINMFNEGTVYISKNIDVYDLLDKDQEDKLLELVADDKVEKYLSKDFEESFLDKLKYDLKILEEIQSLWKDIEKEPKLEKFIEILQTDKDLINKKIVVFTESKETSEIVYEKLSLIFKNKVMRYSSDGGYFNNNRFSSESSRIIINENFDPKSKNQKDDINILITTDVLAEGVNLHRSNILINYDLPWNPIRVLQRVGRVNRIGSSFDKIYIYNCFPTIRSNNEIHLEENIISKIQAFHTMLGEDAKYLSDNEEVQSHGLYQKLNNKSQYEDEDDNQETELKYLNIIREIRDNNPALFEKIKKLPKKARTSRSFKDTNDKDFLISFFRSGALKKFIKSDTNQNTEEIDFMSAIKLFECEKDTIRKKIPKNFFDLLEKNKKFLIELSDNEKKSLDNYQESKNSNSNAIVKIIQYLLKDTCIYTEEDIEFLQKLKNNIETGSVSNQTIYIATKEIKKINLNDKINIINRLKNYFSNYIGLKENKEKNLNNYKEIILSEYFVKE